MKCKALDYWKMIDDNWQKDASVNRFKEDFNENTAIGYKQMDKFIENSYVFFGRDGGDIYEAIHNKVYYSLKNDFGFSDVDISKMLNLEIPNTLKLDNNNNLIYEDKNPYCDEYWRYVDGHINDTLCDIQIAYDIGGKSAIKELQKNSNIDSTIFSFFLIHKTKAYKEKELYGDDNMTKPFWTALSELNIDNGISVYWTENIMYVNDTNDGQASTNVTLFQAYKFAVLINASEFDYTATDEEVRQLSEELLDLIDEDFYRINVWEYIDSISEDFKKLTGIQLDIDDKRNIVCGMTDDDAYGILCDFGSATYIAKLLWRYIKGNNHIKTQTGELLFKDCGNPVAHELADKYLKTDDYDLIKFAKALKEATRYKMDIPKNFDQYLTQSSKISYKCYALLGYWLESNIKCKKEFLVGYIDWFGDYEENERYIYCHIDSNKNEIYFQENRKSPKSAYLHDIAFPHLVSDPNRIQKDIIIKFTEQYVDDIIKDNDGCLDEGYTHCHMYGTTGKYTR